MVPVQKYTILNLEPSDYSEKAKGDLSAEAVYQDIESPEDFDGKIADADIVIVRLQRFLDENFFKKAKNLKAIASATTGLNHIDLEQADKRGIKILSLKGESDFLKTITPTAELHWGLLLGLMRQIGPANQSVMQGHWDRNLFLGSQLAGKTIGIIGFGRLGQIVAQYAEAFRMRVLAFDKKDFEGFQNVEFTSLESLLQASDVISMHLSYDQSTHHFLDYERLKTCKEGSVFINSARGEVVDEKALIKLFKAGHIKGIATDVLSGEVLHAESGFPAENPIWEAAKTSDRILITPHIGGACPDAMRITEEFIADKIVQFIKTQT